MTAKQLNDRAEECRVIMGLMRDEASIAMMTLIIEQYDKMADQCDKMVEQLPNIEAK